MNKTIKLFGLEITLTICKAGQHNRRASDPRPRVEFDEAKRAALVAEVVTDDLMAKARAARMRVKSTNNPVIA